MRNIARIAGVSAAVVAVMGMGAPAFAGGHGHGKDIEQHYSYDKHWAYEANSGPAGHGGHGGEATNFLSCLINLPILSPGNDQVCIAGADGGDGGSSLAGIDQ